jgi:hypothetical protein
MTFARRTAVLAASVAVSGGLLAAGPASATAPTTRHVSDLLPGNQVTQLAPHSQLGALSVQRLDGYGGYGQWNPNPSGSIPGDSIRACDNTSDGWAIETWLDSNRDGTIDRIASTRGHTAGYCSAWKAGNLPENTYVNIYVVQVKGDSLGLYAEYRAYTS